MRALFRRLLGIWPRAFRDRFGPDVLDQAEAECRRAFERGALAGWGCVASTCVDLVRSGLAERWRPTWRADGNRYRWEGGVGMVTNGWMGDLGHAARSLRKAPGFVFAAVATLALALGANTAIFSVVDRVLLDPLPYDDADRLVQVAASAPGSDLPEEFGVSTEFYVQYRDESTRLQSVSAYTTGTSTVRADDRVERLRLAWPSIELFETLGVSPVLGRGPVEGEGGRVAVISHGLWTTWFGADPSVIGRSNHFAGADREIIGVMAPGFDFPMEEVTAWLPQEYTVQATGRLGLDLVGRLAPGADHASLRRELGTLASRLPELYGGSPRYARLIEQHVPVVRPLEEQILGPVSQALQVLMGAVVVVLLIACANVANLFVVRAQGRSRDLAVRRAMGAERGELVRLQLAEAILVAGLAGGLAIVLARIGLPAFVAAVPDVHSRVGDGRLTAASLGFTFGAAALAAVLAGLGPALAASRTDLGRLRDGTRGTTTRRHWARDGLVTAQTALTLVLLVGSGLLLRSFQELRDLDPGYDTEDILTFQFAPEEAHLVDGPTWARFHMDFMDRLRALPGVESVGIVENVPLDEGARGVSLVTEAMDADDPDGGPRGLLTFAGGDYFEAMGVEVLKGRAFTDEDVTVPGRVVVSRAAAELLWPGEEPIGRRMRTDALPGWHTVVGVVEDVRQDDVREEPGPLVYFPMVGPEPRSWWLASPGYVVRTTRADAIAPEIRELVREVAPSAPMYRVHTMEALWARSTARLSFTMLTLGIAAGLALVLGAIGLYGVLSHVVAERTREIGVRMALGAEGARVRRMVVGQGARVVGLGIAGGLVAALLGTRLLSGLLFGVEPVDAPTFGVMAAALAAVGVLASWIPAWRASRVDPVQAMQE